MTRANTPKKTNVRRTQKVDEYVFRSTLAQIRDIREIIRY